MDGECCHEMKDPDAGEDLRQKEKGEGDDEMVR